MKRTKGDANLSERKTRKKRYMHILDESELLQTSRRIAKTRKPILCYIRPAPPKPPTPLSHAQHISTIVSSHVPSMKRQRHGKEMARNSVRQTRKCARNTVARDQICRVQSTDTYCAVRCSALVRAQRTRMMGAYRRHDTRMLVKMKDTRGKIHSKIHVIK